jgi:hypothetical protein
MRRITLIHCGAASLIMGGVVAGGMFASGCGGDDNGGSPGSEDSGPDGTNIQPGDDGPTGSDVTTKPPGDTGTNNNPDAADAAPPVPVHGKLILVNASTMAPPLRFCYGAISGDAGAIKILPNVFPAPRTLLGVPPGTGGPAADSPVDLANRTIEIYALNALDPALLSQPLDGGAELACDKLLGPDGVSPLAADAGGLGFTPGVNYWDIGTLPSGTLLDGTTTLLVVDGCPPNVTDPNDKLVECGKAPTSTNGSTAYDVTKGNLGFWTAKLDTTTALDGGSIGAQFAYASYPFSFVSANGPPPNGPAAVAGFYVLTTFIPDAGAPADAGDAAVEAAAPVTINVPHLVAGGVTNGQLAPTTLVPVSGVTFDGKSGFFANVVTPDGGPTGYNVPVPLPSIQQISAPGLDGGYFANGVGYVFVLVGDPGQAQLTDAGQFNTLSPHILGFPTNPPFPN